MTTNFHTPHAVGAPLTSAGVNAPLGTLDAAITILKTNAYHAMTYGAVGDGVTNDQPALASAISAAAATGGEVILPAGTFLLGSELVLQSGITMRGAGRKTVLLASSSNHIRFLHGTGVSNVIIADLAIDGQKAASGGATDADAILIDGASVNVQVRGCYITAASRDGIAFRGASRGCLAIGNYIENSREDGITMNGEAHRVIGNHIKSSWGDGILIKGAVRCTVEGNTIDTPGTGAAAAGVSLGGDGAAANDYNAVIGNTVTGASGSSLYIANSNFCSIQGNTLKSGADVGITVSGSKDCAVSGNTINTMALHGISVGTSGGSGFTADRCDISGNSISNIGGTVQFGISIASGGGHAIRGNRINTTSGHGIQVTTSNVQIVDNYIVGVTVAAQCGIRTTGSDITMIGNRMDSPKLSGISHSGGARVVIIGNLIHEAGGRGILIATSVNGTCSNNLVRNSGNDGVVAEGIILSDCTDFTVIGNRSYDDQGTPTQLYGIRSIGTSNFNNVSANACRGNVTAGVNLVGANNEVAGANI